MSSTFKSVAQKVERLKDELEDATEESVDDSMDDVEDALRRRLRMNGSVASGTLLRSLDNTQVSIDSSIATRRILGAYYWKYLEFGTGIYTGRGYSAPDVPPPLDPIYTWVVESGIVPDPLGPYDTQRELAQAVQHSIPTGTRSHPFVRPVWRGPNGRRHVVEHLADSMSDAVHRTF